VTRWSTSKPFYGGTHSRVGFAAAERAIRQQAEDHGDTA
jgi:CDGSH-type Zn-finger protein